MPLARRRDLQGSYLPLERRRALFVIQLMRRRGLCTGVLWYSPVSGERRDGFQARTRASPCGQDTSVPEVPQGVHE